jgi:hypothetical protein
MFVVDKSSTGAEILFRMEPIWKERLVVKLRVGRGVLSPASEGLLRRVVKALESDIVTG